jgi:cytochrome o ubiquinol oxidase subunit II
MIPAPSALLIAASSTSILEPAGPVARGERIILLDALMIMLAIVVPTIIATLAFAWWYRASNPKARYLPHWSYSGRLELIIWSIPTLIILFLGGVIWTGSHQLDPGETLPSQARALEIQVVSLDWKWLFVYPAQRVATVNELIVPAGRPMHFSITSASVMNHFFVPRLGGMIAAMNRMVTHLHLQADTPGEYYGQSAQFSGDGFSDMHFTVRALPPQQFDAWLAAARRAGPVLDRASYAQLATQSQNVRPFSYRDADPGLFHAIVSQDIPPAPGPQLGRTGPDVHPQGAH